MSAHAVAHDDLGEKIEEDLRAWGVRKRIDDEPGVGWPPETWLAKVRRRCIERPDAPRKALPEMADDPTFRLISATYAMLCQHERQCADVIRLWYVERLPPDAIGEAMRIGRRQVYALRKEARGKIAWSVLTSAHVIGHTLGTLE